MNHCSKCNVEKNVEEFGIDKSRKNGRNIHCKSCKNEYAKRYYLPYIPTQKSSEQQKKRREWERKYREKSGTSNAEKCREWYQRNLEHARKLSNEATKRYLSTENGRKKSSQKASNWDKKNPEKRRCHERTMYAVEKGRLIRPNQCSKCKKSCTPHAHHEDHSKHLEVIWLCSQCHFYLHHGHKHYRERLNEETPKGDAKVPTSDESGRD
jgi:hypothetical protein